MHGVPHGAMKANAHVTALLFARETHFTSSLIKWMVDDDDDDGGKRFNRRIPSVSEHSFGRRSLAVDVKQVLQPPSQKVAYEVYEVLYPQCFRTNTAWILKGGWML